LSLNTILQGYVEEMRSCLGDAHQQDPNVARIDFVMPGINSRFDRLEKKMEDERSAIRKEIRSEIQDGMTSIARGLHDRMAKVAKVVGNELEIAGRKIGEGLQIEETVETVVAADDLGRGGGVGEVFTPPVIVQNRIGIRSMQSLYNEFYGLEEFSGRPVEGGLEGLEILTQKKWRRAFPQHDQRFFLRMASAAQGIKALAQDVGLEPAFQLVENVYSGKRNLVALIAWMQGEGLLSKRKRKRNSDGDNLFGGVDG
jgi:hypothetical protein